MGLLLTICGSALAAPSWLAPLSLSLEGHEASSAQLAVNEQGDAIAAWSDTVGGGLRSAVATMHTAGGAWETPITLSAPGVRVDTTDVGLDQQGDATAIWNAYDETVHEEFVQAAARPAGGAWQAPVNLSLAGEDPTDPELTVDASGNALAVWNDNSGAEKLMASERPSGGTWQAPVAIPESEGTISFRVTRDARGDAIVMWWVFDGVTDVVRAALRPAGGEWLSPVRLSPAGEQARPGTVAFDARGDATADWSYREGTSEILQSAVLPAGSATWEAPVELASARPYVDDLAIGVDAAGDATAAWNEGLVGEEVVRAATRPAGGSWQPPATVSVGAYGADEVSLAVDPAGDATIAWEQEPDGVHEVVWAARRPANGSWTTPFALSRPTVDAYGPLITADGQGDALAAWTEEGGTSELIRSAAYDAVGPQLRGLIAPSSGVAGSPVSFSVSPFDVWSAIAATSWSFGDGTTGAGSAVTHTYAAPGTYTVGLSSADAVGNATNASTQIKIAPAPPPGSQRVTPPTISRLRQTHRRWREGSRTAKLARRLSKDSSKHSRRPPLGTTFSFTLDQPARVALAFTQSVPGRKLGHKCVASTGHNVRHRRCRRTVTRDTLTYTTTAGTHMVAFQGRIGRRRLPLGAYLLNATATNTATHLRSSTRKLHFTIVR